MMSATTFDYAEVADKAMKALRGAFPNAAIETEEGFGGRVHVRIITPDLNGRGEREKQAVVWEVLNRELGECAQGVSIVLPYGMDELP
jgi:hypothetical protein